LVRHTLINQLVRLYEENRSENWIWFEDVVSYSNPSLSHAMLACGTDLKRDDLTEIGLDTLRWLVELQKSEEDYFTPVGSNGFYRRGGPRARFDQQPIEAGAMVSACLEAWKISGDEYWHRAAMRALEWFLGRNDLKLSLYDGRTGGCRDGLHSDRANQNEGAEATLSFLTALVETKQAFETICSTAAVAVAS
jgi:hypothetical protein